MLTRIQVNNFRSLQAFELDIKPGLNVLVGPNGSGKTNIVKWLDFLSLLGGYSLREAIGRIGGASQVFRRGTAGSYETELSFTIEGQSNIENYYYINKEDHTVISNCFYRMTASISIIDNQIFFSRQRVEMWLTGKKKKLRNGISPNLYVDWNYDILTNEVSVSKKIRKPRLKNTPDNDYLDYIFSELNHLDNFLANKDLSENLINNAKSYPFDIMSIIMDDLRYAQSYNINPGSVRSTVDISSPPGVQFDGAGVASTLYDLQAAGDFVSGRRYRVRRQRTVPSAAVFQRIVEYFRLSNSAIEGITVQLNNFRNEFDLQVKVTYNDEHFSLPMTLLSDGTVKWMALVTAIATQNSAFCIEEPENFLHPRLQENIISILRSEISSGERESRFAIITTHSETLLNTLHPEEIIIVTMENGRTEIRRIEDSEEISSTIRESGFGLGYLYVSGGF